jgi:hypothetical protein
MTWIGYRISGAFNPSHFTKAVAYLTGRHESLRSSFLAADGKYYIAAEENDRFCATAVSDSPTGGQGREPEGWIHFEDHVFDMQKGPLFLVRTAPEGNGNYLVAIKIHHAIVDTWSMDVLMRDLITAYLSFSQGAVPVLPPLSFQYRDWLGWRRSLIEENLAARKYYWYSQFKELPRQLLIPGAKKSRGGSGCRAGKKEYFSIDGDTYARLQRLRRQYHVSMFVLLQASFKLYLFRLTGQSDILIGTMVFGRQGITGLEDQIGFYAYTDLNRIVFDKGDSLREAIGKVKRSYEDMHRYSDYTLLMALSDLQPHGNGSTGPFWNVNLDFSDVMDTTEDGTGRQGGVGGSPDMRFDRLPDRLPDGLREGLSGPDAAMVTDMDLKLKFVTGASNIEVRVLYDCELYDAPAINDLIWGYLNSL